MTKLCPRALSAAKQADVTPLSDAHEPQLISKALLIRGRGREIARRAVRRDSPPQRNCFPWRWRSLLLFPTKTSRRRAESRGNTRETNKLTIRPQIGFSSLIRVFFFFRFFFGASSFELNHPVSCALLWESEPPSHSEKRCRLVSFTKFNYMRAICDFFFFYVAYIC